MPHTSERERAADAIQALTRAIAPHQYNLAQGRPEFRINPGERSDQVRNLQVIANYLNGNDHIAVDGIYGPDTIAALSKIVHHVPGFNPTDGLSYTEIGLLANVAQTRVTAGQAAETITGAPKTVEGLAREAGNRIEGAVSALRGQG